LQDTFCTFFSQEVLAAALFLFAEALQEWIIHAVVWKTWREA